jgi:hypothetical protein
MPMPQIRNRQKIDVALSFAEENRGFVACVAEKLEEKGLKIFYDDRERIKLWGTNLYSYLDDIYRRKSRFCVIFISKPYKDKFWTQHERRSALLRAVGEKKEYMLPFRLDDTDIPEIHPEIVYLSIEKYDCSQLADAIADKVRLDAQKRSWQNVLKLITVAIAGCGISMVGLPDKLTPVDVLARRIYEKSKITEVTRCSDGTISFSEGSGSCSSHGGVWQNNVDTVIYNKSLEECREEAAAISLFPP